MMLQYKVHCMFKLMDLFFYFFIQAPDSITKNLTECQPQEKHHMIV